MQLRQMQFFFTEFNPLGGNHFGASLFWFNYVPIRKRYAREIIFIIKKKQYPEVAENLPAARSARR
jgi:hypothetical protein